MLKHLCYLEPQKRVQACVHVQACTPPPQNQTTIKIMGQTVQTQLIMGASAKGIQSAYTNRQSESADWQKVRQAWEVQPLPAGSLTNRPQQEERPAGVRTIPNLVDECSLWVSLKESENPSPCSRLLQLFNFSCRNLFHVYTFCLGKEKENGTETSNFHILWGSAKCCSGSVHHSRTNC